WPDRIVVTLAEDPRESFSVSWRTDAGVRGARAEIVVAGMQSRIDLAAAVVPAESQIVELARKRVDDAVFSLRWNDNLAPVAYHSVTFTGLAPDTLYAYRVMGAEGHWSEWLQTRTAPSADEPFRFLYFGDTQDGIRSHWARVVREAFTTAPDARFAVHAGDLVNVASRDFEWAEWFEAVGFIHGMIPAVPVVGNHEYFDGLRDADNRSVNSLSLQWQPQFVLPEARALPAELAETVYALRYGEAIVVVLNSMADAYYAAQAEWLDDVLAASDANWKIVVMHHPLFELVARSYPGLVETGPQRREAFLPVIERHGVDLVLQGHDHAYGRGAAHAVSERRSGSVGTVFVTSSSGAKMYRIAEEGWSEFEAFGVELTRRGENTPLFQVVAIDGDSLTFEAHTATGLLYDAFRLDKRALGRNRLTPLPVDVTDERRFDNTALYEDPRLDDIPSLPAP
ncbi:MAG: metallophosphoesterase family protein, partial [Gammaproteobacteria bacterium]